MKPKTIGMLLLLGLVGCHSPQKQSSTADDSQIIESTILWRATIDAVTWEPLELKSMLSDSSRFRQEGNFYKVKDSTKAFGHEALYIGMVGIDLIPGPNVMLKGDPDNVAQYITRHNGIKLIKKGEEYQAELKQDIMLCVAPHPSRKGATLVIGAYLGK